MKRDADRRIRALLELRRQHPAWLLLNARTGPILLGLLRSSFDEQLKGIDLDEAHQRLAEALEYYAASGELEPHEDYLLAAKREVREWIRRELVAEREGRLLATDALESAFRFVDGLDGRAMTTTATRLSIVQREIDALESRLNPNPKDRERKIAAQIAELQRELAAVRRGEVELLPEDQAEEAIRELYHLAMSLCHDFRRVEDSYRAADQRLRQSIIGEQSHRGEIVDALLQSQEELLQTDEGKVFDAFQRQLSRSIELDAMQHKIRSLMKRRAAARALRWEQQMELRQLRMRLVSESGSVIRARQRSERDVKGFLKTGLAAEHHRVGQLLNELFAQAALLDWQAQATRRAPAPLPPIGIANPSLPLVERLRFKNPEEPIENTLDLMERNADLDEIDAEFWSAFDGLDRQALIDATRGLLVERNGPMTIGEIASELCPEQDLEALALWLAVALEAQIPLGEEIEQLELESADGPRVRFSLPRVELDSRVLDSVELDL